MHQIGKLNFLEVMQSLRGNACLQELCRRTGAWKLLQVVLAYSLHLTGSNAPQELDSEVLTFYEPTVRNSLASALCDIIASC